MSGYLVTSPYGSQIANSWRCLQCPDGWPESGRQIGEVRASASAHVASAGHSVSLSHGTAEHLYPVATEAEQVTG